MFAASGLFGQSRVTFPSTQNASSANESTVKESSGKDEEAEPELQTPTGFDRIELGLDIEEVKQRLKGDGNFLFRGDPDVSMLRSPNETLIEVEGASYIDRGYFQFRDRKLFTIILELNPSLIDHYTMYTTFVARFGEPSYLNPEETVWEFDAIRLSLEKPLRVKYIDTEIFGEILSESRRAESLSRRNRADFLDRF